MLSPRCTSPAAGMIGHIIHKVLHHVAARRHDECDGRVTCALRRAYWLTSGISPHASVAAASGQAAISCARCGTLASSPEAELAASSVANGLGTRRVGLVLRLRMVVAAAALRHAGDGCCGGALRSVASRCVEAGVTHRPAGC